MPACLAGIRAQLIVAGLLGFGIDFVVGQAGPRTECCRALESSLAKETWNRMMQMLYMMGTQRRVLGNAGRVQV